MVVPHRRTIELEDKAKVVASVWGANLFNSLPRKLFFLGRLQKRMNLTFSFKQTKAKHLARQGIEQIIIGSALDYGGSGPGFESGISLRVTVFTVKNLHLRPEKKEN